VRVRGSRRARLGALSSVGFAVVVGLLAAASSAAPPSLGLSATDTVVGGTIHANAQLSESTPTAEGEISFEVFGPGDSGCSGPALTPAPTPASVLGEGEYGSGEITPPAAGTYKWSAHYSGDGENPPADSTCSAISTVSKASPGLTGSASPSTVNAAIHDEVTLTGGFSPGGEVTFVVYGPGDTGCLTPLDTDSAPIEGNHATSDDFIPPEAGAFRWSVEYPGDENNEAATLACTAVNQTSIVSKASPGLTGTATASVTVGGTITDSATLSGGFSPGGSLLFRAYAPGDETCTGGVQYEASVPVSGDDSYSPAGFATAAAGLYRWKVDYSGDTNNETFSLGCGVTNQTSAVAQASPGLTGTATASVTVGGTISDSATLSGGFNPGGSLVFRAYGPGDSTCTGTVQYQSPPEPVNGNGPYSPAGFATAAAGPYRWTVSYSGDGNNEVANLSCGAAEQTSTATKAAPTMTGSASDSVVNAAIHDEVTLSGGFSPSGEVTFAVFGPGDSGCSTALQTETVPLQSGHATSAGFTPPEAGEFRWTAVYAGDDNNETVGLGCGVANQASTVGKASPSLVGTATSVPALGAKIDDSAVLSGGFNPGGTLVFRVYGPGDSTCTGPIQYEDPAVPVNDNGPYSPAGFKPAVAGLYRWTVTYSGDVDNESAETACNIDGQSSAVGQVHVILKASATGGTIGEPVTATASIEEGAIPAGQITFRAFAPGDATCSGAVVFSATVAVAGNGAYGSGAFVPTRVGAFRWTASYSGDVNHFPASSGCGEATSSLAQARPSINGAVSGRLKVGAPFRAAAVLQGGYAPTGTITFQIYGPIGADCSTPLAVDSVRIAGNGVTYSDPFVPGRSGRYRFVAAYSGDAANQAASEVCGGSGQLTQADKRTPKVKPRAGLSGRRISIRAHLSGAVSPSGAVIFRLYGPRDERCKRKPAFSGSLAVGANGSYLLAKYLATKSGTYRLSVGYSGDVRNQRKVGSCRGAQVIHVG
jgi:hypothetical protein